MGQSASRDSATSVCTNHHVAFPEHLPYDHRDPTMSPWYEHRPEWEAKPLGPMTQRGGLPGNLVLGSPSPSNLSSMRITRDAPPPAPWPNPSPPSSTPAPTQGWWREEQPSPGSWAQRSGPQTCLEPECLYAPLHSCLLLEPGACETRPPGLSPQCHLLVKCPGCGTHHSSVLGGVDCLPGVS